MSRSDAVRLTTAAALFAVGVVIFTGGGMLSGLVCIVAAVAIAWRVYRHW